MNKQNNKSGFTLIEIIVVLIIVGILAAIALPNLFSNIAKSKGGQALITLDNAKTLLEAYYTLHSSQNTGGGGDLQSTGSPLSVDISGTHFWIDTPVTAIAGTPNATSGLVVQATGNIATTNTLTYTLRACDGAGSGSGNCITLVRLTSAAWSCSVQTSGTYSGLC